MVGPASLPAAFQTGYTTFSVTITANAFVRDLRGERLRFATYDYEDCSALFNC
jgi:hypothetical protein